jgi:hypothetical protein
MYAPKLIPVKPLPDLPTIKKIQPGSGIGMPRTIPMKPLLDLPAIKKVHPDSAVSGYLERCP